MAGIEERFTRLSPAAQEAVEAFIDFLLSREEEPDRTEGETRMDDSFHSPGSEAEDREKRSMPCEGKTESGIICAEERALDEKNDIIDFADINSRFGEKEVKNDSPGPVRQRKMFDWL
jgi:hypothetical protein